MPMLRKPVILPGRIYPGRLVRQFLNLVPGPNVASANPQRRNSASASAAASYSVDAVISTTWVIPSWSTVDQLAFQYRQKTHPLTCNKIVSGKKSDFTRLYSEDKCW